MPLLPDPQAVPQVEMRKVSPDGGGSWGSNGPADSRGGSARGGGGGAGNSVVVRGRYYSGLASETEKRASMGMTRYGGGGPNTTRVYIG